MNKPVLKFIWVVALLSGCSACAEGVVGLGAVTFTEAAVPLYVRNQTVAVVHVGRLGSEYERKGFFSIGLLPVLTGRNVVFEFRCADKAATALQSAHSWLKPIAGGRRIELRQARFVFPAQSAPRLEAGCVRFARDGRWHLSDGVVFREGTNEHHLGEAMLQVTGENAGDLISQAAIDGPMNLFAGLTSTNQTQKLKENR